MGDARCREECAQWLNKPGPVTYSDREVTLPAIWNFLEAVEDGNPIYWDEETAKASRFGRVIAPNTYLFSATFRNWWEPNFLRRQREEELRKQGPNPQAEVMEIVRRHGYTTATNVSREDEYLDVWGPGDGRIKQQSTVVDVSEEKQTRPGKGVFITWVTEYRTEVGDRLIARSRNVLLMYDSSQPRRD